MSKVSIRCHVYSNSIINECTTGLLEAPLVPASIEPKALDSLDFCEEAGF